MSLADGDDTATIVGIQIARDLVIDAGTGANAVGLSSSCTIGGSLSVASGAGSVTLQDAEVARNVTVAPTQGQMNVSMVGGHVGGNFTIAARGQDLFSDYAFTNAVIDGRLAVSNKLGAHGFGDATTLSINGSEVGGVTVKAGTGDYVFEFVDSMTAQGKGGISLSYGVGDVVANIDNGLVRGSVSLRTAGGLAAMAYDTTLTICNRSTVTEKLTVQTFDSEDIVVLDRVDVLRGVNINTGTGTSTVAIYNSTFGGERVGETLRLYPSTIAQTTSDSLFPRTPPH